MGENLRHYMLDFLCGRMDAEQMQQAVMKIYKRHPQRQFYGTVDTNDNNSCEHILTALAADLPDGMPMEEQEAHKLARLKLFALWQSTFPGVPCVDFGEGEESEYFQTLNALRNHYDVLRSGTWEPLYACGGAYAYVRVIEGGRDPFGQEKMDNMAVALLNREPEQDATFDLDLNRWCEKSIIDPLDNYDAIPLSGGHLQLTLGPLQGRVLLRDRWGARRGVRRAGGILLHPSSLPSPGGIGDLGREAYRFIEFLEESGQSYWQVLPLNPPAAGNSPYQCFSAFAGNPLLIDLRGLAGDGLLGEQELASQPDPPAGVVDAAMVEKQKEKMLRLAFTRFAGNEPAFEEFCSEQAGWLEDFSLYMALKKHFGGKPWNQWEKGAAFRRPAPLAHYRERLSAEINYQKFLQFTFFRQWLALKGHAGQHGIKVIGDLPLFVAHDSSDVWSRPHLFTLDEAGNPQVMAGVPPDYFSKTGQLWGNPHYRWDVMESEGYRWWKDRLRVLTGLVDLVRIDHFLGLDRYWEVPAGEKTAEKGTWGKGPGEKLFTSLREELGDDLPLIAEDLGLVTPEVRELKQRLGLPGMQVLQFMVEPHLGARLHLPLYERDTVLYTGTHDNDTLLGWFRSGGKERGAAPDENISDEIAPREEGNNVAAEGPENGESREICRYFIEEALRSDAALVIIPIQDILFLGSSARMNIPGTVEGNWSWRLKGEELTETVARELRGLMENYRRMPQGN